MAKEFLQLDLFQDMGITNQITGEQLRDLGMQTALNHAESEVLDWGDKAYNLLLRYIERSGEFMCENFRDWCKDKLPEPPCKRAFGPIMMRAAKNNIIKQIGTAHVKNPNANCANANVWVKY